MIVVDTSALIAIYLAEWDADLFEHAIFDAARIVVGAPTAFEFTMVAHIRRPSAPEPETLLERLGIRIAPWTDAHREIAQQAFARFGKGQGRPAQLNFGDCMAYALAKSLDAPLLFKGGDFARTDLRSAL